MGDQNVQEHVAEASRDQHVKADIEQKQNEIIKLQAELVLLLSHQVAGLSSVIQGMAKLLPKGPAASTEGSLTAQRCMVSLASAQSVNLRIKALTDQVHALHRDIANQ
jgi:hypothetical protein